MMTRSLRGRLVLWLTGVAALALVAAAGTAMLLSAWFVSYRAEQQLELTASRLETSEARSWTAESITGLRSDPLGVVLLGAGRQPLDSANVAPDAVAAVASGTDERYLKRSVDVSSQKITESRTSHLISTAVLTYDTAGRSTAVLGTALANVITAGLCLVAFTFAAYAVVGHGLRPLRAMADQARQIAEGDRTARLPVHEAGDPAMELLARTVNTAFDAQQGAESRLREFVADTSHELRSPLTAATGWVELYLHGGLTDPDQRGRAMERVHGTLHRMKQLIEELAVLARVDSGHPLDLGEVNLAALVREVVVDARVITPDRSIEVLGDEPAFVLGDEARLTQIVHNLIGNAVQHTPDNAAVTLRVEAGRVRHRLTIHDTGPGIPEQDLPHLFDRFWRADKAAPHHSGGSGLGLAIVSALVKAHHGHVAVTSSAASGTTFTVDLPALPDTIS